MYVCNSLLMKRSFIDALCDQWDVGLIYVCILWEEVQRNSKADAGLKPSGNL